MNIFKKKPASQQTKIQTLRAEDVTAVAGGRPSNCVSDGHGGAWCVVPPVVKRG